MSFRPLFGGDRGGVAAPYAALLQKTGQTTQYDSKLDDGFYQKGVAKSYTILTTGQYSGTTNITLNSKTDVKSNNCVQDENTGLMWSRYESLILGPSNNGTLPWTTNGDGEGIFDYAAAANTASFAGYSDWRIPNIFEYVSLADFEAPTMYPDATAFVNINPQQWSSSTYPAGTTLGHYIYWVNGYVVYRVAKTTALRTLLVRGG